MPDSDRPARNDDAMPPLARARAGAEWNGRPMYLRPYHPTYLVSYYARRGEAKDPASAVKWDPLVARVEQEPELEIYLVDCFDDACAGCPVLRPDPYGCMWGVGYSCPSANKPDLVRDVVEGNRRILGELELGIGSRIALRDLVPLLEERVPTLYPIIGGAQNQAPYEQGLAELKAKYGL